MEILPWLSVSCMFYLMLSMYLHSFIDFISRSFRMEREEGELPSDGELGGMNNTVRNEEMNSDGHGGRKETAKLADTVKSLQKEVQSYKVDNEQILIHLNDTLVHNLN